MSLISVSTETPVPQADARLVNVSALEQELRAAIAGEVRFDAVSRALYSTDASVYQIHPIGVVIAKSREDVIRTVEICYRLRCPLTMRGGGTSQAGQAIGSGIVLDTSKYLNRVLEVCIAERWVRVEPGIVLDELNAQLKPYGLRFAPDISTASRATIGGMMANNSAGARSVLYGKTIDHVLEQEVLLSDGSIAKFAPLTAEEFVMASGGDELRARCYRVVQRVSRELATEVEARFPKVLRRVGGYNLDHFHKVDSTFDLTKLMVGSEGTLGVVLEAKLKLVPLPKAKAVLTIQFHELLDALGATPAILAHGPSAVEVMDGFILSHTKQSPALERIRRSFIEGDPGALLCVEFYDESGDLVRERVSGLQRDMERRGLGYRYYAALELNDQAKVWSLREAALGLSMAMKEDAKSLSFVEDTAVAPEKLRDYIARFLEIIRKHGTAAGMYAHASVGCLHVRPVVNMKTDEGVQKFAAIAAEISDLVLEFGGALSGEHGDGLVRSPFMRKMFGSALYEGFREIKRTFDPRGILNPGKIVDAPELTANLRFGAGYRTPNPSTYFNYSAYGGMGGAVEMCSGLGACRKTLEGTMCPSYMATRDERDVTRGRANVLRLAMAGRLAEAGLDDKGVYETLDLCLECRACKAECPVGVDVARFKSEFLAQYWAKHGVSFQARILGHVHDVAALGSAFPGLSNWLSEKGRGLVGIDARRSVPKLAAQTAGRLLRNRETAANPVVLIFNDTFTNYYNPEIAIAAWDILEFAGVPTALASNGCCGRPLISKGLLKDARERVRKNTELLHPAAERGQKFLFCEPSCLSAVREDAPSLLRGEEQQQAKTVAAASISFEEYVAELDLKVPSGARQVLLHGHCHQKAMGLFPPAKALLSRVATVVDSEAGCCGMAGSFGYTADHFEVSRQIAERKLLPAIRNRQPGVPIVAAGMSCRHQIHDVAGEIAVHPAVYLNSLLRGNA